MPPEITLDRTPADAEWDTYVMRHPRATFFHLTGWQHVVEKTFAYRSFSCATRCNGHITGVLPLFLVRHLPFGYALESAPLAVYGGICADDIGSRDVLLSYAQSLARQLQVHYLELRQLEPVQDLPVKELYVTFRKAIDRDPAKNMAVCIFPPRIWSCLSYLCCVAQRRHAGRGDDFLFPRSGITVLWGGVPGSIPVCRE